MAGMLRSLVWDMKMKILSTWRYKFSVISDIVVFSLLMIFFLTSRTGTSLSEKYMGADYRTLLLVGYIAWTLSISAISSVGNEISSELSKGTFYRKMHSKYPLVILYLGDLIASFVTQIVVIAGLLIIAKVFWNVSISFSFTIVIALIINLLGMYGIGLIVGGLSVLYKRIGAIVLLIQLGMLFITDTIPISQSLLAVTKVIPLTSCNEVIRTCLSNNVDTYSFVMLLLSSAIWIIIGGIVFYMSIRKAKRRGNLLYY